MDKPLQIVFKNMETSEFLESLIRARVDRLERFSHQIVSCRVAIDVPHRSAGSGKVPLGISIELDLPGRALVAKESEDRRELKDDDVAYINRAFEIIERQLRETPTSRAERAAVRHDSEGTTGVVSQLFPEQNYGFIEVSGSPELYFTRNAIIRGSFDDLEVGMMVHVTPATAEGPMGPQASSVRLPETARGS